jgi:hypothetical protein
VGAGGLGLTVGGGAGVVLRGTAPGGGDVAAGGRDVAAPAEATPAPRASPSLGLGEGDGSAAGGASRVARSKPGGEDRGWDTGRTTSGKTLVTERAGSRPRMAKVENDPANSRSAAAAMTRSCRVRNSGVLAARAARVVARSAGGGPSHGSGGLAISGPGRPPDARRRGTASSGTDDKAVRPSRPIS